MAVTRCVLDTGTVADTGRVPEIGTVPVKAMVPVGGTVRVRATVPVTAGPADGVTVSCAVPVMAAGAVVVIARPGRATGCVTPAVDVMVAETAAPAPAAVAVKDRAGSGIVTILPDDAPTGVAVGGGTAVAAGAVVARGATVGVTTPAGAMLSMDATAR
jgi:hypothetical protein